MPGWLGTITGLAAIGVAISLLFAAGYWRKTLRILNQHQKQEAERQSDFARQSGAQRTTTLTSDIAGDGDPMPVRRRFGLIIFLLGLAVGLIYVLVALWSVDFPDAQFKGPPRLTKAPANLSAGKPYIEDLDPYSVVAGSTQPMVTIYGYNFDAKAQPKVLFNTADRQALVVSPNKLLVPLTSADTAQAGMITISVIQNGESSDPRTLQVIGSSKSLGQLKLIPANMAGIPITEETRLVLLVLFAGALGSYIHAIKSVVDYIGNRTLTASWFWFYFARPFIGMSLALIFYAVIRGGFLAGTPADAKSVNPFGVVALAGLVGMFADKAAQKLGEIFDTMFKTEDTRKDKLAPLKITTASLGDVTIGQPYTQPVTAAGGQVPYKWSATGLPAGVEMNGDTGALGGKTDVPGEANVTIAVTDHSGLTVQQKFTIRVKPAQP